MTRWFGITLLLFLLLSTHAGAAKKSKISPPPAVAAAEANAAFTATIEVLDDQIWLILPIELRTRIDQENWTVLAFLYLSDEIPPQKHAYVLQNQGEYYLLPAVYPQQKSWALQVLLAPSKGAALEKTFRFFDRNLIKDDPL